MARKLTPAIDFSLLPTFHRRAVFQLSPEQDYDDLTFGALFVRWQNATTAAMLADPQIPTRDKAIYCKINQREHRHYCHSESSDFGRIGNRKSLPSRIEQRGSDRYEIRYVYPVQLVSWVPETLPGYAVEYLETAGDDGSEQLFRRVMRDICITPEQRDFLHQHDLTIDDLSCGRYSGDLSATIAQFYQDWNVKLGERFWSN